MRTRYQRGYLRLGHRKTRPACWEFLCWDNVPGGRRVRRKAIIGTVLQYPNVEDAWQASNGLRVSINEARNRQPEQVITVADLVDHYTETELAFDLSRSADISQRLIPVHLRFYPPVVRLRNECLVLNQFQFNLPLANITTNRALGH